MLVAAGTSLALLVAAGDPSGWSATVQSAVGGGSEPPSVQPGSASSVTGEANVSGRFAVSLQDLTLGSAAVTYSPTFVFRRGLSGDLTGAGDSMRHAGKLDLGTRLAPSTELSLYGHGEWGLTDFSPLSRISFAADSPAVTTPPPPPSLPSAGGRVPASRFVHTLDLDAGVGLTQAFSRDLRLSLGAGFHRTGGAGHEAVQVLPAQSGPQATTALAWTVDPENILSLRAAVSQNRFGPDRSSTLGDVLASWALRLDRAWGLETTAGAGLVRSQVDDLATSASYLSGSLRLRWAPPHARARRVSASVGVSLAPGVDPIAGQPIQSVRSDGDVIVTERDWAFAATLAAGRIVNGIGTGAEDFAVGTRGSWLFAPNWAAELGVGAGYTNQVPIEGLRSQVSLGLRWGTGGRL